MIKPSYHLLAFCLVLSASYSAHAATAVIDQQNDPQPISQFDNVAALAPIQTFRPALAGIDFAEFIFNNFEGPPAQLVVSVRDGVGGAILGTSAVVEIPDDDSISYYRFLFPTRIPLMPSQTYALQVVQISGGTAWICERLENNYADGTAYWDGMTPQDYDYNFREGILIPEPASWALISLGLIVCLGRRDL